MRIVTQREFLRQADEPAEPSDEEIPERVARILDAVRRRGDAAVAEYTEALDGVKPRKVRYGPDAMEGAWDRLDDPLREALETAAQAIETFQTETKPKDAVRVETRPGVTVTLQWEPLARVLCYVPGGRAAYPSTVLMTAIPAQVAGVGEVYVATPPGNDGAPSQAVLAAAHRAGVDAVYAIGGAQAIAAFAYGTDHVPRVDMVVGPGNAYVTEAKRQLVGHVGIDMLAGPSELAIVADDDADPELVALDLAAQAEHDPDARAVGIVPNAEYARRVAEAAKKITAESDRRQILATSLDEQGVLVVAKTMREQLALLEAAAPEHVQLMVRRPAKYRQKLRAAGTVFEGVTTSAPLGDYVTGANHVLPTGRTARWRGPLGVYDFLKPVVLQRVTQAGLDEIGPAAVALADAEGLGAHAESVRRRLDA